MVELIGKKKAAAVMSTMYFIEILDKRVKVLEDTVSAIMELLNKVASMEKPYEHVRHEPEEAAEAGNQTDADRSVSDGGRLGSSGHQSDCVDGGGKSS